MRTSKFGERDMGHGQKDWIILRTMGRHTMRLAGSLAAAGFDVWTPIETKTVTVPRLNVKREIRLPIMPSYVFARADRVVDLLELRPPAHVDFSVMRHADRMIPSISDDQLTALRRLEAKRTPRKKAERTFTTGVEVRVKVEGGSFSGLQGRVVRSDSSYTLVCFNERIEVKIATCLLHLDEVEADRSSGEDRPRKAA